MRSANAPTMSRFQLYPAVIAVVAWSSSLPAHPHRKLDVAGVTTVDGHILSNEDFLVVNRSHVLTLDDLRVLAERPDNGWHLGWFKRRPLDPGNVGGEPGAFDLPP